jgi:hypothetical protein
VQQSVGGVRDKHASFAHCTITNNHAFYRHHFHTYKQPLAFLVHSRYKNWNQTTCLHYIYTKLSSTFNPSFAHPTPRNNSSSSRGEQRPSKRAKTEEPSHHLKPQNAFQEMYTNTISTPSPSFGKDEFVRLIAQALNDLGYA